MVKSVSKTSVNDTLDAALMDQQVRRLENQSRKIGYARVSTDNQNLDLQLNALRAAGCEELFEDTLSGATETRSGLDAALAELSDSDVLVVWKLDRLGRSLSHLIEVINQLGERGVGFRSLSENIDTTTAGGRLVFHVMGAMAEFERNLIAERTRAGLDAAKARGARLGRPVALSLSQIEHARLLLGQGESASSVARSMGVGRSTLYRRLKATGQV
jgi:DNA invertase Pin-like site-specific DNA recombinase